MRKAQKQQAEELVRQMEEAHDQIKMFIEQGSIPSAMELLEDCQNGGITLGTLIEDTEGEGHPTVLLLEEYCELVYQIHEELAENRDVNIKKIYKILRQKLIKVFNSLKNDIHIKLEVAFFPYKASMWDSLESVYLAAKKDVDCDVYCIPIPYYDLNPDHSFGEMHYEGNEYPENIEIIDWQNYIFEERRPDVIYIHNPYDNCNLVTSVHPRFYSSNLKQYTDTLVYIPYYSISGKMSEAQSFCPAYIYADYIVIQSPEYRKCFDTRIPDRKFLPFGSPKFDRIIKRCQTLPEPLPEWKERIVGRKVYFFNTSISGMLADTEAFLKKMKYVFQCFEGRDNVCLLWRPHPLLESTFDSMRPQYRQNYETLKQMFLEKDIGILDMTPDIADSIGLSDAYIGDIGTSITSLFGIAGKPMFILNNKIHCEPKADDWRREIAIGFNAGDEDQFALVQRNKLFVSKPYKYDFKYFCDLPDDAYGNRYLCVHDVNGKKYVCPSYDECILVLGEQGIEKRIELEPKEVKGRAFAGAWKYDKYLVLLPLNYPAIVCYDTATGEIRYFNENTDVFVAEKEDGKRMGGSIVYQGALYMASPVDNRIYKLHIVSGKTQVIELPVQSGHGYSVLIEHKDEIWGLPWVGGEIIRWNPNSGEVQEYILDFPEEFTCVHPVYGYKCEELPFGIPAFYGQYMYLSPSWANMYLKLNINTGELVQWQPPFMGEKSIFVQCAQKEAESEFQVYSITKQKLYCINMETDICREIEIHFDMGELRKHDPGFSEYSEGLKYMCLENSFNSLNGFLDGNIAGGQFDKDRQLEVYRKTAANSDGSCGQKINEFIRTKLT